MLLGTCLMLLVTMWFIDHDFAVMGQWEFKVGHTVEESAKIMASDWRSGEIARRLAFPAAAFWGILLAWAAPRRRSADWRRLLAMLLTAYVLLCFASVLWSDQPVITIKKDVTLFCMAIAGVGMGLTLRPQQLCLAVAVVTSTLALFAFGAEIVCGAFRPENDAYRLSGTLHPNYMAAYVSAACISSFCLWQSGRWAPWGANALVMLLLTILTKSRMALVALLAALLIVYVGRRSRAGLLMAISFSMTAIACALLLLGSINRAAQQDLYRLVVLNRLDEVGSLTGRTPLWGELIPQVAERPLVGHGYAAFWSMDRYADVASEIGWAASHAHCAYLGVMLELLVAGMALWTTIAVLATLIALRRFRDTANPGYGFLLGFGAFVLLFSCTETMFFMVHGLALLLTPGLVMLALPGGEEGQT
jgi:exopolysaccharide production protein ExoQ